MKYYACSAVSTKDSLGENEPSDVFQIQVSDHRETPRKSRFGYGNCHAEPAMTL